MSVRSKVPGDEHDGGYKRPFTVVPDDSLERVQRDVTAKFGDVPLWGVAELFRRVHEELGSPDVTRIRADLTIEYSNLTEEEYEKLVSLSDKFWIIVDLEVTKARLYPSRDSKE